MKWQRMDIGNYILVRPDYTISYNPNVAANELGKLFGDILGAIVDEKYSEKNGEETALIVKKPGTLENVYKILVGDFRAEYEKCKSLEEALKVYARNKKEFDSPWTT